MYNGIKKKFSRRLQNLADNTAISSLYDLSDGQLGIKTTDDDSFDLGVKLGHLSLNKSIGCAHHQEQVHIYYVTANEASGTTTFYFVGGLREITSNLKVHGERN